MLHRIIKQMPPKIVWNGYFETLTKGGLNLDYYLPQNVENLCVYLIMIMWYLLLTFTGLHLRNIHNHLYNYK